MAIKKIARRLRRALRKRGGSITENMPTSSRGVGRPRKKKRDTYNIPDFVDPAFTIGKSIPGNIGFAFMMADAFRKAIKANKENEIMSNHDSKAPGLSLLKRGLKLFTNDKGVGAIESRFDGVIKMHDNTKIYKLHEEFVMGSKDAKLQLAKKLYGSQTFPLHSTEKTAYARLYAYAGLNTKGIYAPYGALPPAPLYTDIDVFVPSSMDGYTHQGEYLADEALMLKTSLQPVGSTAGALTNMPPIVSGDEDYFFPIQSFSMDFRITNTDAFLPCMVKIYVLKAKNDLPNSAPQVQWFNDPSLTQDVNKMSNNYINYWVPETITGCTGTPITSKNIAPQATPLMSQDFKDCYEILKVHNQKLGPSDSLEYSMVKHYSKCISAQEYNKLADDNIRTKAGSIHYMIEFQGLPCPYYKTTAAGAVDYSAMAHSSFAKIRVTSNKYFTHSMPVTNAQSLFLPTGTNYSQNFVSAKRRPLSLYSDTAPYSSFASNTSAASAYVIPLATAETYTAARPLVNDP